jgi:hypothetical protein
MKDEILLALDKVDVYYDAGLIVLESMQNYNNKLCDLLSLNHDTSIIMEANVFENLRKVFKNLIDKLKELIKNIFKKHDKSDKKEIKDNKEHMKEIYHELKHELEEKQNSDKHNEESIPDSNGQKGKGKLLPMLLSAGFASSIIAGGKILITKKTTKKNEEKFNELHLAISETGTLEIMIPNYFDKLLQKYFFNINLPNFEIPESTNIQEYVNQTIKMMEDYFSTEKEYIITTIMPTKSDLLKEKPVPLEDIFDIIFKNRDIEYIGDRIRELEDRLASKYPKNWHDDENDLTRNAHYQNLTDKEISMLNEIEVKSVEIYKRRLSLYDNLAITIIDMIKDVDDDYKNIMSFLDDTTNFNHIDNNLNGYNYYNHYHSDMSNKNPLKFIGNLAVNYKHITRILIKVLSQGSLTGFVTGEVDPKDIMTNDSSIVKMAPEEDRNNTNSGFMMGYQFEEVKALYGKNLFNDGYFARSRIIRTEDDMYTDTLSETYIGVLYIETDSSDTAVALGTYFEHYSDEIRKQLPKLIDKQTNEQSKAFLHSELDYDERDYPYTIHTNILYQIIQNGLNRGSHEEQHNVDINKGFIVVLRDDTSIKDIPIPIKENFKETPIDDHHVYVQRW